MIIINTINQNTFRELLASDSDVEIGAGEEVEWFADLEENMIGTVGEGEQDRGWSCVVLERGADGRFHVCARQHHFLTRHTAEMELFRQLVGTEHVAA